MKAFIVLVIFTAFVIYFYEPVSTTSSSDDNYVIHSGVSLTIPTSITEQMQEEYRVKQAKHEHYVAITRELSEKNKVCELGFISNNSGWVTPPSYYVTEISKFSCEDQQVLTKIAYYESTWNLSAVNGCFAGYYQIGKLCSGGTFDWVSSVTGISEDHSMALWIYENYPQWFESITANSNNF